MKRRVNFTVDAELYAAAQCVAKVWKRSVSGMVEYPLRRTVEHMTLHGAASDLTPEEHWLDRFHRKHLPDTLAHRTTKKTTTQKRERLRGEG